MNTTQTTDRDLPSAGAASNVVSLSQGSLSLLSDCPRKFQYAVLEQLSLPNPPDQQARQEQGARFHLLVQQWLMDLPIAPLRATDRQLNQWLSSFEDAAPEILSVFPAHADAQSAIESERSLYFNGYRLVVRYDLVLSTPEQAQILDWKTYPKPQSDRWLRQTWQTRLYLFVLVETSPYSPEQVSMVYWFFQGTNPADVNSPDLNPADLDLAKDLAKDLANLNSADLERTQGDRNPSDGSPPSSPQSLRLTYTGAQHEQTRTDLQQLLHNLTQWLTHYHQNATPLPQHGIAKEHCPTCSFFTRCFNRAPIGNATLDEVGDEFPAESWGIANLADIVEIPL
jgi:PD-(D/E)XK nuclease superfamily